MIKALEIAQIISGSIVGDEQQSISHIRPIKSKEKGGLAIVFAKKDLSHISEAFADIIIGPPEILECNVKTKIDYRQLKSRQN